MVAHPAAGKGSIVVVEDDPDFRRLICESLLSAGYHVTGARNGREALEYLRETPAPDLIVLDLVMPVMDGWEFRREQVADPSLASIPVLILTVVEAPMMPTGAAAYLRKPFDLPRLLNIISVICQQRRAGAGASSDTPRGAGHVSTTIH